MRMHVAKSYAEGGICPRAAEPCPPLRVLVPEKTTKARVEEGTGEFATTKQ